MNLSTSPWWTWAVVAGLGTFHGLNPAMGWLLAVALGLYRRSRRVVLLSLVPIALGHAIAAACVLTAGLSLSATLDHRALTRVCGVLLIGWAAWHAWRGHRMRSRVGMQAGFFGLTAWSFLMASAHGAGLMLIPALLPLCSGTSIGDASGPTMLPNSLSGFAPIATLAGAALFVHTVAMLATTAAVSVIVFDRIGVACLRTKWVNADLLWTASLFGCGIVQLGM
jgi:hypothetical protein